MGVCTFLSGALGCLKSSSCMGGAVGRAGRGGGVGCVNKSSITCVGGGGGEKRVGRRRRGGGGEYCAGGVGGAGDGSGCSAACCVADKWGAAVN